MALSTESTASLEKDLKGLKAEKGALTDQIKEVNRKIRILKELLGVKE